MNDQRIDRYLMGRMAPSAARKIERRQAVDTDFAQDLAMRKRLLEKIEDLGDQAMKKRLMGIHQKEMSRVQQGKRRRLILSYAAVAALVLGLFLGPWYWMQEQGPLDLYTMHYEAYPLHFNQRNGQVSELTLALDETYQNESYTLALSLASHLLEKEAGNDKVRLARAICWMEMGDMEKAQADFQYLLQSEFSPFQEQALWYTALIELAMGNKEKARRQLQPILDDPHSVFYRRALALIAEF